jgi:hypothetical protein
MSGASDSLPQSPCLNSETTIAISNAATDATAAQHAAVIRNSARREFMAIHLTQNTEWIRCFLPLFQDIQRPSLERAENPQVSQSLDCTTNTKSLLASLFHGSDPKPTSHRTFRKYRICLALFCK